MEVNYVKNKLSLCDEASLITKLLLNLNNTDAASRKIIVTVVHWCERDRTLLSSACCALV
jgi:hypothetical protein